MIDNVKYVKIEVAVRYDEDDIPNNFPFRKNNLLILTVEHPSGKIIGFPIDYMFDHEWMINNLGIKTTEDILNTKRFHLGMKITDQGSYYLLDENMNEIASIENDYVPDRYSIPGEFGDYLNFYINLETRIIENWYGQNSSFKEFI